MSNEEGILAVELSGGNRVRIYTDSGAREEPFEPWLLVETPDLFERAEFSGVTSASPLKGGGEYRHLVRFRTWSDFLAARDRLASDGIPHFRISSPVQQYLLMAGKTLFRGMRFPDLRRMQVDIETLSLDPQAPESRIVLIAVSDTGGFEEVLNGRTHSEAVLLERLNAIIADRNPAAIEGHNLFDFDLPYLAARAAACGVRLAWGRDGSELRFRQEPGRFKVGGRTPPYRPSFVYGRHLIDTLQQVQRHDVAGAMESYGLKNAVRDLGLERKDRTFVEGKEIGNVWRTDPERLAAYALDDVRDVRALSDVVTPTAFYQTQILPYTFQDAARSGTGEKINHLLIGVYLRRGLAIPRPRAVQDFPGGYTEVREVGLFRRVVKADVESLYPSVMLAYRIHPATDTEDVFLPMLERLTRRRLDAKSRVKSAAGPERAYWDGLQGSYKILVNSFYGYLGYGQASFNDYEAARQVTERGQEIVLKTVSLLEALGASILEVDTDGVYFVAPPGVDDEASEQRLVEGVSEALPEGIRLSHDGRYSGMISLKAKNYALMDYEGKLILKGSSLRSRRDERICRELISRTARALIEGKPEEAFRLYREMTGRVREGAVSVHEFCRWESVTDKTFTNPNLKRLAGVAAGRAVGRRMAVYQRRDGSLARVEDYDGDEDRDYLLRRLHDAASRFRDLFTESEFRRHFPLGRSDAREQLSLF